MTAPIDPQIAAAREVLRRCLQDIRASVAGLPPRALNRRPAGGDSNSIAVLATHALSSARYWLSLALAEEPPPRDRPAEFRASAPDADALLAFVDETGRECLELLDPERRVDWSSPCAITTQLSPGADEQITAAWALLHALEHLREHVGQMLLTRQLWDRRSNP